MEIVAIVVLFVATLILGLYDRYGVQRAYADVYAQVHGHVPPLYEWFYTPDSHADVERWRRRHRNLLILSVALSVIWVILILRQIPPSG